MNTYRVDPDTEPDVEIAHRILNALVVKGTNQKALAEDTDISLSTLRRSLDQKRTDRRSLNTLELGKIANTLEVPVSALLPASWSQGTQV